MLENLKLCPVSENIGDIGRPVQFLDPNPNEKASLRRFDDQLKSRSVIDKDKVLEQMTEIWPYSYIATDHYSELVELCHATAVKSLEQISH